MLKVLYAAIVSIVCFRFSPEVNLISNLDPSWRYAINIFHSEPDPLLWGSKVIFTYGPLGFVFNPMPVASDVKISLIFWITSALLVCLLFVYILFSKKLEHINSRRTNLFFSFILFYSGAYIFGGFISTYITSFMILCLLALCWETGRIKFFVLAAMLSVLSMFLKFNSGASDFISLLAFSILVILHRRRTVINYILILCAVPLLFAACFLIYNPDLNELVYYIRGAYEISAGYNSAMSVPINSILYVANFIVLIILFLFLLRTFDFHKIKHSNSIDYILIFAVSVFAAFKHSFVRADHYRIFISTLCIYGAVYVLFMKHELAESFGTSRAMKKLMCIFFVITLIITPDVHNKARDYLIRNFATDNRTTIITHNFYRLVRTSLLNPVHELCNAVKNVKDSGSLALKDVRQRKLPEDFKAAIQDSKTTVYPWLISYRHDISNFVPMPICQAYSAYTSWLDNMNAKFFSDDDTAPRFIVFNLDAIDNRFPLIECPATWLEIFRHYRINRISGKEFLLERSKARELKAKEISTQRYSRNGTISIPSTKNYCLMRINLKLNLLGQLAKILYKIPYVNMRVEFTDGRIITKRVLIETLANETLISSLPLDEESFTAVMSGDRQVNRVKAFTLEGPGLKWYNSSMEVTFTEI